ncbi:MAG: hypothetical protein JWQ71_1832 [Pedosphaera sp.]|nr:hypothetical protein [Pedosphaera sp.]
MTDEWAPAPAPKKPRRWPRRLLWISCGTFLFLILFYFFATSHFFLDNFILPKVNSALHATITVGDSSISPFFKVTLEDVKIKTSVVEEPLLTAKAIRTRYSLMDIIGGNINVDLLSIDSPVIQITQYADGSRNIDPLLSSSSTPPANPPPKSGKPPQILVKSLQLTNATIRLVRHSLDGTRETAEASNLVINVADFGNGKTTKVDIAVDAKLDKTPGQMRANLPSSLLMAKLAGQFECGLTTDLQISSFRGHAAFDISQAPDDYKDLAALHVGLDCDLTPTELTQLSLSFLRNDKTLAQINLSGPLDLVKQEGKVKLAVSAIDRQMLNVFGKSLGLDFGLTTLSSTNEIELLNGGKIINVTGKFNANKFGVSQKDATTKPLDLQVDFKVAIDQVQQTALISTFALTGNQEQSPLLLGALTRPMKLSFGTNSTAVEESAFELVITNLNLADWRGFIGDYTGLANLKLNLLAQAAGKKIKVDFSSSVTDLSAKAGTRNIDQTDVMVTVRGQVEDFSKVQLEEYNLQVLRQKQPMLGINGVGNYDIKSGNADVQTKLDTSLPKLAELLSMPELKASSGAVKLTARLLQTNLTPSRTNNPILDQSIAGNLQLENFTGQYSAYRFEQFETGVDFDTGIKDQTVEIRKLIGALKAKGKSGGTFDISGNYNLTNSSGQLRARVVDLNQVALSSFLAPVLGNMTLASANINITADATYDAKGESLIKGDFKMADFLVVDPQNQLPNVPLTAEIRVDAAVKNDIANIAECAGHIDQGNQPGGRFEVTGNYDLKKQAGQVALKLTDLNQNALRPLLASSLGDKTLKSISISSTATANYDAKGDSAVTGEIHLSNFLMTDPANQLPKVSIASDINLDVLLRENVAEIRQFIGKVALGDLPGGDLSLKGQYDLKKQTGQADFKLNDLNQNALSPFLTSALGDKKLTSVSINADASAAYDANGDTSVKGEFGIANLLLKDPEGKLPKVPLAVGLKVDAGFARKVLRLDKTQLTWFQPGGDKTFVQFAGRVDMAKPNVISGDLQISSEAINLDPIYALLSPAPTNAPASTAAKSAAKPVQTPPPTTAQPQVEPAPIKLPLQQFTLDVRIKQLTLREVGIKDLVATTKIDGGQINLKPLQFVLNDTPVSVLLDLNLEVPGFQYSGTYAAEKLSLEPLVNTFAPEQRGHIKGFLLAKGQFRGAGITGPNLRKNLNGQFDLTIDNANLDVTSPLVKGFLVPVAIALSSPSILESPLTYVNANVRAGTGTIKLADFKAESASFSATTAGDIPIADVVANSPFEKFPVHFALERSLATGIGMVPRNASADSRHVMMPDFLRLVGTLGQPKAEIIKSALVGMAARKALGLPQSTPTAPSIKTPTVNTPSLNTPTINTPSVNTPSLNTPTLNTPTLNSPFIKTP